MVEQNVPLAQTIEEKEDESPSPKVLVNEKSSLLMFAPNWTKNDSKEGQVLPMEFHMEARGPPPVPTGDQDGTARESKLTGVHASTRQAPTVPQPKGATRIVKDVQSNDSWKQWPTWLANCNPYNPDLKFCDQFDVDVSRTSDDRERTSKEGQNLPKDYPTKACNPQPVPLGDQDRKKVNYNHREVVSFVSKSWQQVGEKTPTHPPKISERKEDPEKVNNTSKEKKHCESCFLSNLPTDHEESDEEYHDTNLQYVAPYFKGISCNRCGEKDISEFRYYCDTCRNYNLCPECNELSREDEVTFISKEGKRHEPNHDLRRNKKK